jgi:hypothetical protein
VDTAISTHLSWKDSIISFYDFTTPPSSPSSGDRYIASSTVGDFTENYIYEYDGSAYDEIIPNEGDSLYVVGGSTFSDQCITYNGSSWVSLGSAVNHQSLIGAGTKTHSDLDNLWNGTTESSSTSTGQLVMSGGLAVQKNINIGGVQRIVNATDASSSASGCAIFSGGIGIQKKAYIGSDLNVTGVINANNDTESTSATTGALIVAGGLGTTKNIFCTGNLDVHNGINNTTIYSDIVRLTGSGDKVYIQPSNNAQTSGLWNDILFTPFIQGGSPAFTISQNNITIHHSSLNTKTINISVDTNGDGLIDCSGNDLSFASTDAIRILNTNDATSSSTGALICSGGISIAKKLYISDTTSGSASSGSIVSLGGASFAKDIYCGGDLFVKNGLNATTIMSDVLRIQGQSDKSYIYPSNNDQSTGQWNDIIFALYGSTTPVFTIGEDSITINNGSSDNLNISVDDDGYTTFDASGNIINFHADNVVKVLNETDSTSTSTGGLQVSGGISASKQVYAGSNLVAATSVITPKIVINSGSDLDHYSTTTLNVASTTGSWTSGNALTGRITRVGNNVTITWNEVTDTLDDTNSGIVYVSAIPSTYRPTSTIEIFTKIVHNNIDEIGNMEITDAGYVNFSRFTSPQIFTTGICGYRSGTITYNII